MKYIFLSIYLILHPFSNSIARSDFEYKILNENDYVKMPWVNGKGVTYEIARGNFYNSKTWDWRVSRAEVTEDNEFSLFPEVDRKITVLNGEGIELSFPNKTKILLNNQRIYSFQGENAPTSKLIGNNVQDFNVMTRRGIAESNLQNLENNFKPKLEEINLFYIISDKCNFIITQKSPQNLFKKITLDKNNTLIIGDKYELQIGSKCKGLFTSINKVKE
ncbi:MAG: HutD family protein [Sphingobacteriia bacterium]|nr:HutD family protein [Sphingobacteriia bacterium]